MHIAPTLPLLIPLALFLRFALEIIKNAIFDSFNFISLFLLLPMSYCSFWQARKGEPENTPQEILSMVKSLASPPHRILLFLQQSSVEWCSSLWLDSIREIDPAFRRTIVVVSKFDNRLKV